MGIKVASGFDLNAPQLLDSKSVQSTMTDLENMITDKIAVEGQIAYCKEDGVVYILKNVNDTLTWMPVASSSSYDSKIAALEEKIKTLTEELENIKSNYVPKSDIKTYEETYDTKNLTIPDYGYTYTDTNN